MDAGKDLRAKIGLGILVGIGGILIGFTVAYSFHINETLFPRIVAIAIPFGIGVTMVVSTVGITQYQLDTHALRISGWTSLCALILSTAVGVNIVQLDFLQLGFGLAAYLVATAAAAGSMIGILIGLYDANQHRIQANLAETRDEAQALSQRLSVLNRVLRHDIRTQTQLLRGYTQQMQAGALDPGAAAEKISEANDRLVNISGEASQLQQLFDSDDNHIETVDVVPLVHEAGDHIESEYDSFTITYDMPESTSARTSPMLTHAIEHLLSNVAEHTDELHADVTVQTVPTAERPVQIIVADDGPGIPDVELIHTTGESESDLRHSKGLGLWLVTWVVEEGEGDIEIETGGERGTTVTISLREP
jgi:signal transduction histidine kinase